MGRITLLLNNPNYKETTYDFERVLDLFEEHQRLAASPSIYWDSVMAASDSDDAIKRRIEYEAALTDPRRI